MFSLFSRRIKLRITPIILLTIIFLASACRTEAEQLAIHSVLQGRLTVDAQVDSIPDYRNFEVVVGQSGTGGLDTLGYAITDSTGFFSMEIEAPERGIYPLLISRYGTILKIDEMVVAEGDTAILNASFPVGQRPLVIRSRENAALMAYKNTMTLHNQALLEKLQTEDPNSDAIAQTMGQTATILWSMRENYENTIGGLLAAARSVVLLSGWNDSLLIERAELIEPSNPSYVEVARSASQAITRLEGPDRGLETLQSFIEPVENEAVRAALQAELVAAYMEHDRPDQARAAAAELAEQFPDTPWADWADRAMYDFENLMPGMEAPNFEAITWDGDSVVLDSLRGTTILLEFYRPEDPVYQRELETRNALYQIAGDRPFEVISVSMQPDPEINEAFFQDRAFPGIRIIAPIAPPEGDDIIAKYNVHVVPRRFLIDARGEIYGRYDGEAMLNVQEDLATVLREAP